MTVQEAWPPETQHGPSGDGGAQAEGAIGVRPAQEFPRTPMPRADPPGVRREAITRGAARLRHLVRGQGWGQSRLPGQVSGAPHETQVKETIKERVQWSSSRARLTCPRREGGPLPQPPGGSEAKHPAPAVGGPEVLFHWDGKLGEAFLLLLEAPVSRF